MILWVLLFALVVAISFVLALKSMVDYQEIPAHAGEEYSLFLIKRPQELSVDLLSSLHHKLLAEGLIISFERLIKGSQAALVVYGPKTLLSQYKHTLDLLELEDYTNVDPRHISAWEVGIKHPDVPNFPPLSLDDQVWWQLALAAKKGDFFHPHIRLIVVSSDDRRREILKQTLQDLSPDKFVKLPKDFSDTSLLDFYKKRGFRKDSNKNLRPEEVINLLKV